MLRFPVRGSSYVFSMESRQSEKINRERAKAACVLKSVGVVFVNLLVSVPGAPCAAWF